MAKREPRADSKEGSLSSAISGNTEALKHLGQSHTGRQGKDMQHSRGIVLHCMRAALILWDPM